MWEELGFYEGFAMMWKAVGESQAAQDECALSPCSTPGDRLSGSSRAAGLRVLTGPLQSLSDALHWALKWPSPTGCMHNWHCHILGPWKVPEQHSLVDTSPQPFSGQVLVAEKARRSIR